MTHLCKIKLSTCRASIFLFAISLNSISGAGASAIPPRGWNSYDSFSFTISEREFLENAKLVAEKLKPHGYEYVVIDYLWYRKLGHGWFRASAKSAGYDTIDKWGRPIPDPKRWPSTRGGKGFAPVAGKVHALGLKLGIHVMRGISTAAVKKKTPVLGAFKDTGRPWNAEDIALMDQPCPWMEQCFVGVNTSSVGGKLFVKSLYDQYASWGIDFIKHDCVFGAENPQLEEVIAVSDAIRNSGRRMIYSLSPGDRATTGLAAVVAQAVNMYRVTGDDWDDWEDLAKHFDVARDFADAGLIGIPSLAGGKSWVDLDMLPFGRLTDAAAAYGPYRDSKLSLNEKKSQMTLWAMARSPLMFGGDMRRLDNETLALLTNPTILELNSHSLGNRNVQGNNEERVWLAGGRNEGQIYVAFFNLSKRSRTITVSLVDLMVAQQTRDPRSIASGYQHYLACSGREAWTQKPVAFVNILSERVSGHGTLLFSLACTVKSRD